MRPLNFGALFLCAVSTCLLTGACGQPFPQMSYPESERVARADTLHGITIRDPYRWLEQLDAEKTRSWIHAQDSLTRSLIEPLPWRDNILRRMKETSPDRQFSAAHPSADGFVYVRTFRDDDDQVHQVLESRTEPESPPHEIIDLNEEYGPDARFATYQSLGEPSFSISPNGRYVAYGVTQKNSRWSRWRVRDLDTGQDLSDVIDGINTSVFTTIWWHPDGSGFFYAPYRATPENVSRTGRPAGHQRIFFHRLNTPQEEDELILERPADPEVTYWIWVTDRDLVIRGSDGTEQFVEIRSLDRVRHGGTVLVRRTTDTYSFIGRTGGRMLFRTTANAPNGKIVSIDPDQPTSNFWHTVVDEGRSVLRGAQLFGGKILAEYRRDAMPEYNILNVDGQLLARVDMPYAGWLRSGFVGRPDHDLVTFTIQNSIDPGSLYQLDMRTGQTNVFDRFTNTFDADDYVSEQVFYTSKDGTRVPMFLFYRKGLVRDGSNPVWLYAYGFNWSALPWYQIQHRMIVDMGGVYALANVRGGSEYGQKWVDAGSGVDRQNSIDDFIAAGEYLIDEGITSSDKLIANGGSSSGPLAGAALTQRPDLFGAALISYPYLDMLRYEKFRTTSPIHGSVRREDEFRALRSWSPYQNVEPGVCYPPTLIAHGNEDQLALPLHSYKFTAALQHAQGCNNPVLLQVAWGRGHTVGGSEERANQLAFLSWVLDHPVPSRWE